MGKKGLPQYAFCVSKGQKKVFEKPCSKRRATASFKDPVSLFHDDRIDLGRLAPQAAQTFARPA